MPSIRDEIAADTANAIAVYGETFECQGRPLIPCTRRRFPAGYDFEDGGEVHKVLEHIIVAKNSIPGMTIEVGDGVDLDTLQIKSIQPAGECLLLIIGSFDEA